MRARWRCVCAQTEDRMCICTCVYGKSGDACAHHFKCKTEKRKSEGIVEAYQWLLGANPSTNTSTSQTHLYFPNPMDGIPHPHTYTCLLP
jgi:hypothetical protein